MAWPARPWASLRVCGQGLGAGGPGPDQVVLWALLVAVQLTSPQVGSSGSLAPSSASFSAQQAAWLLARLVACRAPRVGGPALPRGTPPILSQAAPTVLERRAGKGSSGSPCRETASGRLTVRDAASAPQLSSKHQQHLYVAWWAGGGCGPPCPQRTEGLAGQEGGSEVPRGLGAQAGGPGLQREAGPGDTWPAAVSSGRYSVQKGPVSWRLDLRTPWMTTPGAEGKRAL